MPKALLDPLVLAFPVFILVFVLELVSIRYFDHDHLKRGYEFRDSAANLRMFAVSLVTTSAFRFVSLIGYAALYAYVAPWHLPADSVWTWLGAIVAVDLLWYLYHRFSHRVRIGWAAHQVHHSSEYFNFTTAARQKWNAWFEVLIWIPLPLMGVPPAMVYTVFSINLVYQFFLHTETVGKLWRPIEFVFNTPSHHRVHHGSDPLYLDRNFGGILIMWDRLFRSFQAEVFRPTYGLTKPVNTYRIATLQFGEYQAIWRDLKTATTFRDRLGYLFGPPGWAPVRGGSGMK